MVNRKIKWVSVLNNENTSALLELEKQLANYYSNDQQYYGINEITSDNWVNAGDFCYQQIVSTVSNAQKVCEFGSGSSNILRHHPTFQNKYYGCDFSEAQMIENKKKFPLANFNAITKSNELPYENEQFDCVFSVFVLEHSTNPAALLLECNRILKPGGHLIIVCPDFLGKNRMSSQKAGFSHGTAKAKLQSGKLFDALITLFDNRIKVPFHCWKKRILANKQPQFFINIQPLVLEQYSQIDADAVYVTYKKEIEMFLEKQFQLLPNSAEISQMEDNKGLIFIMAKKQ